MAELLDVMFREARTHSYWQDKPVDDALLTPSMLRLMQDLFVVTYVYIN